jgi:hypothetical protein
MAQAFDDILGGVPADLLACSHLMSPDALAEVLVKQARVLGVLDTTPEDRRWFPIDLALVLAAAGARPAGHPSERHTDDRAPREPAGAVRPQGGQCRLLGSLPDGEQPGHPHDVEHEHDPAVDAHAQPQAARAEDQPGHVHDGEDHAERGQVDVGAMRGR